MGYFADAALKLEQDLANLNANVFAVFQKHTNDIASINDAIKKLQTGTPVPQPIPPVPNNGAKLIWSDEFEKFDLATPQNPNGLWRPNDFYQSLNNAGYEDFASVNSWDTNPNNPAMAAFNPFSIKDSVLTIQAIRTPDSLRAAIQQEMTNSGIPGPVPAWCTGMLIQNPDILAKRIKYGYTEIRSRFQAGKGQFNALWLYNSHGADSGGAKSSSEIDLVEIYGRSGEIHTTIHNTKGTEVALVKADTVDFHTYGLDWQPNTLTFYRDGVPYKVVTGADAQWFNVPMGVRMNLAMDAQWFAGDAKADATTPSPITMGIDYVRVYDKSPYA